ncbi:NAD-dependent deacylase [Kordiimonas sp. SCSIO 12610]|uniref:NAD-dependent deacylase n=1 Tax=Kordiimonas sp. SCSIO 12610 TaxID=2829597 RepID=UPI00210CF29E|nr:NAD-dependent deacylase [Kordiimonas sp. SCSIO 12610]UTW55189.1 NAD-dependent deacylase [Kordiimonas sp. SCSIO 12610]
MQQYRNIVILTGAGISAESGVATFRDNGGLWENHRIEEVATPEAFAADPVLVHNFYNMRRAQLPNVDPNPAHFALAKLEAELDGGCTIVTQNVDNLHERAGSQNVIHMHGELSKLRCNVCLTVHDWETDCFIDTPCPACDQNALRPHIVWFGEMPFFMDEIYGLLRSCDLFISIGTSGNVYPAAGFVSEVMRLGNAHTIEVNLEPSEGASLFTECRHGKAGDLLPDLVDEIIMRD